MPKEKLVIGITMGDPAGIGAEIIVESLQNKKIYDECIPIVYGDYEAIKDAIRFCYTNQKLNVINSVDEAKGEYGTVDLFNFNFLKENGWEYKKVQALCGKAAYAYVVNAIKDAMDKKISAVVTGPLNKESLHLAGLNYCGHTEIFAEKTGTKSYAMMLTSPTLKVIHCTTHCSLRDATDKIKKERVLEVIKLADYALKLLGVSHPKIAVAGLNPHSSENGLFGYEEEREIIPAIEEAKALGYDVVGPEPPDTVFVKAIAKQYDIVVAMYHDQGHIPLKMSGFKLDLRTNRYTSLSGVNTTIGLPIIRTSVDHGTAFGKAGEGRANEESMLDSIEMAIEMAKNWDKVHL
jgi:4-hydroxythreonine-4-phosphate dehydrogenase